MKYDSHTDKALYAFTAIVMGAFFWGCAMANGLIDAALAIAR